MPETIEQRRARKRLDSRRWRAKHPELKRLKDKEYRATHREAIQLKNKRWHEKNRAKERIRVRLQAARRRADDPEKANALLREWRIKNPEKLRVSQQKYAEANRETLRLRSARYRSQHPQKIKQRRQNYKPRQNDRRKNDPVYKIVLNCRQRLRFVLKRSGLIKAEKSFKMLGCDRDFLIAWLEIQFKPGMTWDNYGRNGWHVDHIRPCAAFNLSDPVQLKQCFHFTNLQPLWGSENMSKGGK